MDFHPRHALGLPQRQAMCLALERGMSQKQAAACFCVSPATVNRWWRRWREASEEERGTLGCLRDRSSRPRRSPRRLSAADERPILRARRETNFGPGRLAGILRRARSTIWKVLRRHGLSRRPRGERQSFRRYEWSRPGALLHMDVKRLARFERPGHAVTGDRNRSRIWADKKTNVGNQFAHVVVDDHSRLAYVELHGRENSETNAVTLERAIRWFAELGLSAPEAVMTDNAFVYVHGRRFRELLERVGARHIRTPAYTPRWNGKAERFIRTLQDEWAYVPFASSTERAKTLSSFLRYYNRRRPHSSLGNRPPLSRVHNVRRQDT